MPTHVFTDLDRVVDGVHAAFDAWTESGAFDRALSPDGVEVFRLAVHEWVANLVQHAVFPGPTEVSFGVTVFDDGVRCAIADTSAGFDFVGTVAEQQTQLEGPAPSERGRGLLMVLKCAEDLAYERAADGSSQRVAFTVRRTGIGSMAHLFRAADLTPDPSLADSLRSPSGDGLATPVPSPADR